MSDKRTISELASELEEWALDAERHGSQMVPVHRETLRRLAKALCTTGWFAEMLTDTRHVFDANGLETPQVVRDVIGYVESWAAVYHDKLKDCSPLQEPVGSIDHVEWSASKEQWRHNIWADVKIPFGTKLYTTAKPQGCSHKPEVLTPGQCALLRSAVNQYHLDLDERRHGATAAFALAGRVLQALDMPWERGAALKSKEKS